MSIATTSEFRSPPFPVRRFTVEEYHRMGRAGVLTEEDRVELLEGWIVSKTIRNPKHGATVGLVEAAIKERLSPEWIVRLQSAITTAESEPEPDLAVARGPVRRYLDRHPAPGDVALVVEVADTSLSRDRMKRRLYAAAAIPAYWIVNLVDGCVEVHTSPVQREQEWSYADQLVLRDDEEIPLIIDGQQLASIPAKDLLP